MNSLANAPSGQVEPDLFNEHLARYAFAARLARQKRVLDVACGSGYGAAELAAVARNVTAVDVSPEAIQYAAEHYPQENLDFRVASAHSLPFPDLTFDLVVSFELIEHLENYRELLSEVRRVLAPNGQFIVSTPNRLYYEEDAASPDPTRFTFTNSTSLNFMRPSRNSFLTFPSLSKTTPTPS